LKTREELRCDFCQKFGPRWQFPVEQEQIHLVTYVENDRQKKHYALGCWCACTPCSQLVMRGNIQRLAEKAVDGIMERKGEHTFPKPLMVEAFKGIMAKLLEHLGEREPLQIKEGYGDTYHLEIDPNDTNNAENN